MATIKTPYSYVQSNKNTSHIVVRTNGAPNHAILKVTPSTEITFELKSRARGFQTVFESILHAFTTIWFINLSVSTKKRYTNAFEEFLTWLDKRDEFTVLVVKEFETYEVNERKKKPQSASAISIRNLIDKGKESPEIEADEKRILKNILASTKFSRAEEKVPHTLTHWFTRKTWLRSHMGESYQMLDSPKRLINSFNITVATTLLYLLQARRELSSSAEKKAIIEEYVYCKSPSRNNKNISRLISGLLTLDRNCNPSTPLDNIVWNACVIYKHQERVKQHIIRLELSKVSDILRGVSKSYPFRSPPRLLLEHASISRLEEMLAYWLCVSLAVQPSDANKLKRRNIAVERDKLGRALFLEITYYKSRANRKYKTPLLKGDNIVTKALLEYLDLMPKDRQNLFENELNRHNTFPNPFYSLSEQAVGSDTAILLLLWKSDHLKSILHKSYLENRCCNVFWRAMSCLLDERNISFVNWSHRSKNLKGYEEYCKNVDCPLPESLFHPTHIKNTAVYARADKYRDSDLINSNSHSSITEKLSYLTDHNKEWVNQVGRITRMVMQDIQNNVYKPSIAAADAAVNDKILHTQKINNQIPTNIRIDRLGQAVISSTDLAIRQYEIIVVDNQSTAIVMMHYISQADKFRKTLFLNNSKYFFESVLVNIEWMHYCLSSLDPKNVSAARVKYESIKDYLPDVFDNEINGGFGL